MIVSRLCNVLNLIRCGAEAKSKVKHSRFIKCNQRLLKTDAAEEMKQSCSVKGSANRDGARTAAVDQPTTLPNKKEGSVDKEVQEELRYETWKCIRQIIPLTTKVFVELYV